MLLFPAPGAQLVSEIDPDSFDDVVVIDSTWQQTHQMCMVRS